METLGTILIVDDDPVTLRVLNEMLTIEGYLVETFSTSTSAWERLKSANGTRYGLAILDLALPDGNGQAFAQRIRERYPAIGVLFITATAHPPIIPGMRVIAKPVEDRTAFLGLVWGHLKQAANASGFMRLEQQVGTLALTAERQMASSWRVEAKLDEFTLACAQRMRDAHQQMQDLTLTHVGQRWWAKLDPVVRWALYALFGSTLALLSLVATHVWRASESLRQLPALQHRVETELVPMVRRLAAQEKKGP